VDPLLVRRRDHLHHGSIDEHPLAVSLRHAGYETSLRVLRGIQDEHGDGVDDEDDRLGRDEHGAGVMFTVPPAASGTAVGRWAE
ncbi:hypothetical protein, partial [Micromonospora sp. CPCC 206061]|uniref:hypothetical protein n=1 Tax=Micromonospora sp. CPCC 206061 TaxID=3122410 RepID=UPI002FF2EBA5